MPCRTTPCWLILASVMFNASFLMQITMTSSNSLRNILINLSLLSLSFGYGGTTSMWISARPPFRPTLRRSMPGLRPSCRICGQASVVVTWNSPGTACFNSGVIFQLKRSMRRKGWSSRDCPPQHLTATGLM